MVLLNFVPPFNKKSLTLGKIYFNFLIFYIHHEDFDKTGVIINF